MKKEDRGTYFCVADNGEECDDGDGDDDNDGDGGDADNREQCDGGDEMVFMMMRRIIEGKKSGERLLKGCDSSSHVISDHDVERSEGGDKK